MLDEFTVVIVGWRLLPTKVTVWLVELSSKRTLSNWPKVTALPAALLKFSDVARSQLKPLVPVQTMVLGAAAVKVTVT